MPVCLEVAFAEASCLAAAVLPIPGSVCSFIVVQRLLKTALRT